jgi:hypothetical protein
MLTGTTTAIFAGLGVIDVTLVGVPAIFLDAPTWVDRRGIRHRGDHHRADPVAPQWQRRA